MHELSIAQEIIDFTLKTIPPENYHLVKTIRIYVGEFSNIIPDSLLFCFHSIIDSSPIPNCRLEIELIPLTVYCSNCNMNIEMEPPDFFCRNCGDTNIKIISGQELSIKEIELDDELEEAM
jgi:hydrogenase nickel incorporation protein HypA/HybF